MPFASLWLLSVKARQKEVKTLKIKHSYCIQAVLELHIFVAAFLTQAAVWQGTHHAQKVVFPRVRTNPYILAVLTLQLSHTHGS